MATCWTLAGDATDPQRLGAFWKSALGYVDEDGYDFPDGASLVDPDGRLPAISEGHVMGIVMKDPEGNEFCVA
jgi:Glyoxalase-like domain